MSCSSSSYRSQGSLPLACGSIVLMLKESVRDGPAIFVDEEMLTRGILDWRLHAGRSHISTGRTTAFANSARSWGTAEARVGAPSAREAAVTTRRTRVWICRALGGGVRAKCTPALTTAARLR